MNCVCGLGFEVLRVMRVKIFVHFMLTEAVALVKQQIRTDQILTTAEIRVSVQMS